MRTNTHLRYAYEFAYSSAITECVRTRIFDMRMSSHTRASSKYYYSLIGVTKTDTWRGCDDLSLDRPDP